MLKYSTKSRSTLNDVSQHMIPRANNYANDALNPKNLPYKPTPIMISKPSTRDFYNSGTQTPKTTRTPSDYYSKTNASFSKSINTTPEKDRKIKDVSFNKINKPKQNQVKGLNEVKTALCSQESSQNNNTDRQEKILQTIFFKDISNKEESEKAKLRQTVSNACSWQYKNIFVCSPVKTSNELMRDSPCQTPKSKGCENFFRKKNESEYVGQLQSKNYMKYQIKSQYTSKQHSRNTSTIENHTSSAVNLETLNFKNKNFQSTKITPRGSQQKQGLGLLGREKIMSMTDPNGHFFQPQMIKKTSNMVLKHKQNLLSELKIQDFQLGSCKGEGRFGKVFPAKHKKTGWLVAVKQVKKQSVRLMLSQFIQQIKISLFLNHPNVVKMYGFFHDTLNIYILMEYMEDGSLYRMIKLSKKLSEDEAAVKLSEICEAVHYLHSHDILHRDIKPENIVLSNGVCKLCDFGWATYSKQRRTTYCGTLDYVCPEILEGQSYDNFVDIWAVGVLAYEMLTGKAPFYHISRKQTMKSIMKCDFSFPSQLSISARQFITKALQKEPDNRFTIQSLLKDNFLSQVGFKG